MPPLMLDRDEAVAVAVCLRSTATESIAGGGEAAIRALGKLEQLLPPTLRRQVGTIGSMTTRLGSGGRAGVARAARHDHPRLPRQRAAAGALPGRPWQRDRADARPVPGRQHRQALVPRRPRPRPGRLAHVPRRPHDVEVEPTGHRVELVDPPDPVAFVQAAITTAPYRHRAVVELAAPLAVARRARAPDRRACSSRSTSARTMLTTGADSLDLLTLPPAHARRRLPRPRDRRPARARRRRRSAPAAAAGPHALD